MNAKRVVLNYATVVTLLGACPDASAQPSVEVTVATVPPGLTISVDGTNYVAPTNFDWPSASSHTLIAASPQTAMDGHSRNVFVSWSDGGPQINVISVPSSSTNYTATFSTQYLLELTVQPTGAGSVSNSPSGPWYDAGQAVSLTALTNTGYRFFSWDGVDSSTNSTGQVTMNAFRAVTAKYTLSSFPQIMVVSNGPVAPGDYIGTIGAQGQGVSGRATNVFNVVLDNGAYPLYASPWTNIWRRVTPCGLIPEQFSTYWGLKDETFSVVDTVSPGNGYSIDTHDFQLLPNGDALLLETETWPLDMSQYVAGGRPDAVLKGTVFQEIAPNGQVLFEWHDRFHLPITNSFADLTRPNIDWTHPNSLTIDPLDNNYLLSLRSFSQILKISRTTGDVIWRLGGIGNDFTFIGENPTNAPYYFVGQHNVHRLANGDILFFDNGSGPGLPRRTYSRAVEYHLDETNMTATLVWEYRHVPDILTSSQGIVQRFRNGNTYVGWVSAARQGTEPTFTEVNASNQVMFELSIPGYQGPSWLTKQVWDTPDLIHSDTNQDVAAGPVFNGTNSGVTVTVNSLTETSGNRLIVSTHDDAVRFPQFTGKAPQVLVQRVTLSATNISALSATLTFNLPSNDFCFDTPLYPDPAGLTMYQRPVVGQGTFTPMATVYDPTAKNLTVTGAHLGEFIFTYPDLPEVPIAPILFGQATQGQVNQEEPVVFQWTPNGFARSYHLQVATDPAFANLVVDESGLTNMDYTLASLQPATDYYWRVNVSNTGGTSDWATASFASAPATVQVLAPNGGEAWERGLRYFIQWKDNFSENVILDLYKNGTFVESIATNANNGAYQWEVGLGLAPGNDYSIKISSATNAAVSDMSDAGFSIDVPKVTSVKSMTNGAMVLEWTGSSLNVYVEFTPTLSPAAWTNVAGPINDTSWTIASPPNANSGFYRLRVE